MKLTPYTLLFGATFLAHYITCMETKKEDTLTTILAHMNSMPTDLVQLISQIAGTMTTEYPPVESRRNNKIKLCRLCPKGEWVLTISTIGWLRCQEVDSGRTTFSHCVGRECTDAVISDDHQAILIASSNNGHKIYHIDVRSGAKSDITSTLISHPTNSFKFYDAPNPQCTIIVNEPSLFYNISTKRIYHYYSSQELHAHLNMVTWDTNSIELKIGNQNKSWSSDLAATPAEEHLPEQIKKIKKMVYASKNSMLGITEDGTLFNTTTNGIHTIGKVPPEHSDMHCKANTIAVSYRTETRLLKMYQIFDLLTAYRDKQEPVS